MIDEKKIEEAAILNADKYNPCCTTLDREEVCHGSFEDGVEWFKNALWHPAEEKPILQKGKCLVVYNNGKIDTFGISFVYKMLSDYGKDGIGWKYWAYVSDLLPKKKGGEKW